MNYKEYLNTEHWRNRREKFKSKTWNRCFICRDKNSELHVHHKRYKRKGESILFKERHTDFRLLCKRCHFYIHKHNLMWTLSSGKVKRIYLRDLILKNKPLPRG